MGGVDLADEYPRSPDPYVSLAAAAALTDQIRLGTGVALVAQHHPINLAKAVASVDALSNGRFVLGIGYGWNVEEMAHHGVEFRTRRAQAREHVLARRDVGRARKLRRDLRLPSALRDEVLPVLDEFTRFID